MKSAIALVFSAIALTSVLGAQPKSEFGCGVCNVVVRAIDDFIKTEEPTIENVLEGVCKKLPGDFLQNACESFVTNDFENIVNGLVNEQLSPHQVCVNDLHECSAKSAVKKAVAPKSFTGCEICRTIVGTIDQFIQTEEPTIENVLDGVCNQLPSFLQDTCTNFVHQDFENIINGLIHEQLSPEQVCKKYLHACSSFKAFKSIKAQSKAFGCTACTTIVTAIDNFIQTEEPAVEDVLDDVCDKLPGAYLQGYCRNFVNNDFEKIVNGLINEQLSPNQVCQKYLHAC